MKFTKKTIGIACGIIFVALFAGVYFWKFRKSTESNPAEIPKNYKLSETVQKLNLNPEYLDNEDLKSVRPDELPEYFRQGLIAFKYSTDPKREFGLEIEKKFPGESGRVILEIFKAYCDYDSHVSSLEKNESMDDYEKWNEKILSREKFFGRELKDKLFPKKDSETIEKYFLYTKRYLKKHELDDFRSKRIHLEKAKKEIYGDEFYRLVPLEPIDRQFELEWNLRKKEIEIMSEKEREMIKKEILEDLKK